MRTPQCPRPTPDQLNETGGGGLALISVNAPPAETNVQSGWEPLGQMISQDPSSFKAHQGRAADWVFDPDLHLGSEMGPPWHRQERAIPSCVWPLVVHVASGRYTDHSFVLVMNLITPSQKYCAGYPQLAQNLNVVHARPLSPLQLHPFMLSGATVISWAFP